MKKRLYLNSCSFMDNDAIVSETSPLKHFFKNTNINDKWVENPSHKASLGGSSNEMIFRRTLLDILNNDFDFVIIAWSHPERYLVPNINVKLDYKKLKEDGDRELQGVHYSEPYAYIGGIPGHGATQTAELLKFEPKGTDDTILYTLALHNILNSKNIPHLFMNMGKVDSNVISARENWIRHINPKNYLSMNDDDTLLDKMSFSFVEYFINQGGTEFIKDRGIALINKEKNIDNINQILHKNPYLIDIGGHLSDIAFNIIYELIYKHIIKHDMIDGIIKPNIILKSDTDVKKNLI